MEDITDKKNAIFESTLALIKEHGFHGAPISLVAKNAGVAAGTIYHYFESKEKLICELYDYNRERLMSIIESSFDKDKGYEENFYQIWTNLYKFYIQEPNVLIFFEQFVNSPFNEKKYPNYSQGRLFQFFADGIRKGLIKTIKPEILIVLVLGSISATAKMHLFGKVALSKNDLHRIAEILWDGIASATAKTNVKHLK